MTADRMDEAVTLDEALHTAELADRVTADLRARLAAVIAECDLADSGGRISSFSRRVRRAAEGPGQ